MRGIVLGILFFCFISGPLKADTLTDALIAAYQSSDELQASRAGLRALDETVVQARSATFPQISANVRVVKTSYDSIDYATTDLMTSSVDASLLLYDGGATRAAINAANSRVAASRANLTGVEQGVLLNAAVAYVDVVANSRLVQLAENNVKVLEEQVRATRTRFEVGEVTNTDVAQADARLAASRSDLVSANGALTDAIQIYLRITERQPKNLKPVLNLPKLPRSLKEAQNLALRKHPSIMQAQFNEKAALYDLERAKTNRSPIVSATGSATATNDFDSNTDKALQAGVQMRVPLYEGGNLSSARRQAYELVNQRKSELQNTARLIRQNVASAWTNVDVSRSTIKAVKEQIKASEIAYNGVKEEALLGTRTTLDVLNAENELLNARTDLTTAERNLQVATYDLMANIGLMTVDHLKLGIKTYDVQKNYEKVQSINKRGFDGTVVDRIKRRWTN